MDKTYSQMDTPDKIKLLAMVIQLIAEWKPIPKVVLQAFNPSQLMRLHEVIAQLKAEGLAGPRHRTSERMKRLVYLLTKRGLLPDNTNKDALDSIPPEAANSMKAQETLMLRDSEAYAEQGLRQALATNQFLG